MMKLKMHFIHSTRQNHIQTTFFNQLKVIYHSRRHAIFECIFAPGRDNLTNKLFAILHLSSKVVQSSFTLHQYRKIPILLSSNVLHSKDSNSITKLIQNNERRIKNFLTSQTVNQSHGLTKGLFSFKKLYKDTKKVKKGQRYTPVLHHTKAGSTITRFNHRFGEIGPTLQHQSLKRPYFPFNCKTKADE